MSTDLSHYMNPFPGGIDPTPPGTMIDHYGWRMFGPQDDKDAVIYSRSIDRSVIPTVGRMRKLPKGRIFSQTPNGTMIPGITSADICPTVSILVGSNSDSGDVLGVQYGDPATTKTGNSVFMDAYNASFQSLAAGYVYETSEFDPEEDLSLFVPGALLTTTLDNVNNFDTAGLLKIGRPFIDVIIGIVVRGFAPVTSNAAKSAIAFQGLSFPRLTKAAVDEDNLRD
jgi:hypothetical protein